VTPSSLRLNPSMRRTALSIREGEGRAWISVSRRRFRLLEFTLCASSSVDLLRGQWLNRARRRLAPSGASVRPKRSNRPEKRLEDAAAAMARRIEFG